MANDTSLNQLPLALLDQFDTPQLLLILDRTLTDVLATVDLDPAQLRPAAGVDQLAGLPSVTGAHSFIVYLRRFDSELVREAVDKLTKVEQTQATLHEWLASGRKLCLTYVLAHANRGPLEDLTVFIGGDSYRHDVSTFVELFARTAHLADVMLRKAVSLFPDISALHGGKQGQWLLVDEAGQAVAAPEAVVLALGSVAIATTIRFANAYREQRCREAGILDAFPPLFFIRPETGSPDVLSAKYWAHLCELWHRRDFDMSYFTCVPPVFCGPPTPSAEPTGYGMAVTAMLLTQKHFGRTPDELSQTRFLIEALGSVSHYTIDALIRLYKVPPENILAFDLDWDACARVRSHFGVDVICARNSDFYKGLTSEQRFDVWINNGLGNDVGSADIERLLASGIEVFCGAANNFLRLRDQSDSLAKIFAKGAIAWPDEAASGGGYAMAVLDAYLRCQKKKASTAEAIEHNLTIIMGRNRDMLQEVLREVWDRNPPGQRGAAVWQSIRKHIDDRAQEAHTKTVPRNEIVASADVRHWKLG